MSLRTLILLGTFLSCAAAHPQIVKQPHIEVELISETTGYIPGQPVSLGVRFKTDEHWHVYWVNPGDSGEPTKIAWTLSENAKAGPLQWPHPERLAMGSLHNFGYDGETVLFSVVETSNEATSPLVAQAEAKWLVCQEECIPGKASLRLELPQTDSLSPSEKASLFEATRAKLPSPWNSAPVQATVANGRVRLAMESEAAPTDFFPLTEGVFANSPAPTILTDGTAHQIELALKNNNSTPSQISGVVTLADGSAKLISQTISGGNSLLSMLFFALIGGFLLNLMPCVFPVLSIKVLGFFEQSNQEKGHATAHSIAYLLGILVSFWVLVAGLLALRAGGTHIGWGFQLQSPVFLAALSFIFVAVGMNLLGAFEIGGTFTGVGQKLSQKSGVSGSFFTGVLATLVATPCTAPFMGVAIGFALAQPGWITFLVFTAIGVGMASPYVILAAFPKLITYLPRPGAWMETFKQFLAFPIFLTTLWILSVIAEQTGLSQVFVLMMGLLFFALGLWAYGKTGWRKWQLIFAVAFVGLGLVAGFHDLKPSASKPQVEAGWQNFSESKLSELREANVPVFIDFTASWCITCQVNKKAVLDKQLILDKFQEKGVVLLMADWTNQDEEISKRLETFGRNGVPLYVLFPGKSNAEPIILPQILTQEGVLAALDSI